MEREYRSDLRRYGEISGEDPVPEIIQEAAIRGRVDYLRFLAKKVGLNYEVKGKTALFWLAATEHIAAAELLISLGASVHPKKSGAPSPLQCAAAHNRLEMAQLLLRHGAKPEYEDGAGNTARSIAREGGFEEMCRLLEG